MAFKKNKNRKEKQEMETSVKKSKNSTKNREFIVVTYMFLGLFMVLMGYFVYFNVISSEDVINSPYNVRQDTFSDRIVRGQILSRNKEVLAQTVVAEDGSETRHYPYGNVFSHVIGYASNGKSGIESLSNFSLLRSNAFFLEKIANELREEKNIGDNVITTLDLELQQVAFDALGNNNGAVVVMDPTTGKVLAMVSKPDFNPNTIAIDWDSIVSNTDPSNSVLLNRATQGSYPPGSTFKIITLLEYMRENKSYNDFHFLCEGYIEKDDIRINCYKGSVHGESDLQRVFAKSCNAAFASLGLSLNNTSFLETCNSLLFNTELPISIPYSKSSFVLKKDGDTSEVMQTAIGQGKTLTSPMHLALIASAISNNGVLMNPYFIDHTENYNGITVKEYAPVTYGNLMNPEEAAILNAFMENVVNEGTGSKLSGGNYKAAGKTGSAEYSNEKGQSHAWFIGYASQEDQQKLAVSVIVEGAGAGSEYAVPVAKQIFDAYYN